MLFCLKRGIDAAERRAYPTWTTKNNYLHQKLTAADVFHVLVRYLYKCLYIGVICK